MNLASATAVSARAKSRAMKLMLFSQIDVALRARAHHQRRDIRANAGNAPHALSRRLQRSNCFQLCR